MLREPFTGTWNSTDIGLTKEGYRLRWQYLTDDIERTDGYGFTRIEEFYEGVNLWIAGIFMEYKAGSVNPVNPWNGFTGAGTNFDLGVISRAASAVGKSLVLTATAGTPAAAAPASLTAAVAIQDKGFNVEMLLGPTHREIPFMFWLVPTTISGATRFFSST